MTFILDGMENRQNEEGGRLFLDAVSNEGYKSLTFVTRLRCREKTARFRRRKGQESE